MSTANKLSYLNDTKSLLRTSLNKFGSNILTTDTLRSYDTKLNDIYDKLPKITQSGAGFTLSDVQNGQVDDFKMLGVDLIQDGEPSPDNPQEIKVVEGRQVINISNDINNTSYNIDLNLENIYLAKMPDTNYKNRIYKNNGNWYFEENVKKVVLDGSEDEVWTTFKNSIILNGLWSGKPITMCDSFKETTNGLWVSDSDDYRGMCSSLNTAGQFRCMPLNDMTLSDFKTWLSTHNVTLWYPLDNPITTQITNTTLINQLEAISVHTGTNIITISNSNNMIPEIEITRLKELEKLS